MHELLLLSPTTIAPSGVRHVLAVLAGLAAAQPAPYAALHLVFKPTRAAASVATRSQLPQAAAPGQRVAGASGDLFFLHLVGMLHEDTAGRDSAGGAGGEAPAPAGPASKDTDVPMPDASPAAAPSATPAASATPAGPAAPASSPAAAASSTATGASTTSASSSSTPQVDPTAHPWTLEFRDFPEAPGRRPVTSRLMASVPLAAGDAPGFVRALGYEFAAAHVLRGWRLVHGSVELLLTRILLVPGAAAGKIPVLPVLRRRNLPIPSPVGEEQDGGAAGSPVSASAVSASAASAAAGSVGAASTASSGSGSSASPPDVDSLASLDTGGAFVLTACVRVADDGAPDVLAQAAAELAALRAALRGIVELEPADRSALDTRVRG